MIRQNVAWIYIWKLCYEYRMCPSEDQWIFPITHSSDHHMEYIDYNQCVNLPSWSIVFVHQTNVWKLCHRKSLESCIGDCPLMIRSPFQVGYQTSTTINALIYAHGQLHSALISRKRIWRLDHCIEAMPSKFRVYAFVNVLMSFY